MGKVGEQLLNPEAGWKRYDYKNEKISFLPFPSDWRYASTYVSSHNNAEVRFNFTGTKLIIMYNAYNNSNKNQKILLDNVLYINVGYNTSTVKNNTIIFKVENLPNIEHSFRMFRDNNVELRFDNVDIDIGGELLPYSPYMPYKTSIVSNNVSYTYKDLLLQQITSKDFQNIDSLDFLTEKQLTLEQDYDSIITTEDNKKIYSFKLKDKSYKSVLEGKCIESGGENNV